ncbi:LpqB family beta-propeller domain-containing protein [Terracidiphilus gabretensis]|uniref:LpqB family beta-propeller domain-containing protein n=1 Tax=Terracidiphilus gabretensis TaxID=1577687 RepID=UPI00071B8DA3|nr:LpqB family beta-propeller domain-containing protein [Terracidiphilus gabretensis]
MSERAPGIAPSERLPEDLLDSWKEIAEYLSRDVTTVQRWEKREGMPVHRHVHDRMGSVYASRAELDAWMRSRKLRAAQEIGNSAILPDPPAQSPLIAVSTSRTRWRLILPLAATAAALAIVASFWLYKTEYFWRSPLANARFQTVTDFGGSEQAATLSGDGHFVAFLSDRDGPMDVWVTQVGSGEFHNLTHGMAPDLVNSSIRTLGFSPDGSLVTFWVRKQNNSGNSDISVWAVPTLGGEPRAYLQGVAEFDWSRDGARLAYHTPGPGDPLFVSDGGLRSENKPIFTAPAGLHAHFPLWAPDAAFIYFVQGELPDKLDIWRIRPGGGTPERITSHNARVTYPVLLDRRTLVYLASDPDGSGPWLYSLDLERRIPHRLTSDLERYTSLAVSADGRRLVTTRTAADRTLWRMHIEDSSAELSEAERIPLTTSPGFSPRLGPNYLLYVSATGTGEGVWKLANGTSTELWRGEGAKVFGAPAISADGRQVAFSVRQSGQSLLYVVQADGTNARVVAGSLDLQGNPAWSPDGQSITTAVTDQGVPHLFRIPIDGRAPTPIVRDYSIDPAWSPDGHFVVYSGPDIGSTFSLKASTNEGAQHPLSTLTMTRGARRVAFLPGGHALMLLRGEIQHKNLWLIDLETGAERQLTHLAPESDIQDFDISPDGHEVVIERVQERSNLVLLDLQRP